MRNAQVNLSSFSFVVARTFHFSPVNKTVCPLECTALMSSLCVLTRDLQAMKNALIIAIFGAIHSFLKHQLSFCEVRTASKQPNPPSCPRKQQG
jgi:hypothetical protein